MVIRLSTASLTSWMTWKSWPMRTLYVKHINGRDRSYLLEAW